MWMRGAAGAGKSAIAQTIAQILEERGQLSSSFFFNRRTSATGRSDNKIATLAYQMSKHMPETRPFISANILADPLVFEMSLESQLEGLIVKPPSLLSDTIENDQLPRLIIIDGLDECSNKDRAQSHVVTAFILALSRMQHKVPHKLLVASRPEYDIQEAFRNPKFASVTRQLHLDDTWQPDDDIRTFLLDSFREISLTHPLFRTREIHWPSKDDVEHLVRKSSGQFIYVSVVVKYIQSSRHDPGERLGSGMRHSMYPAVNRAYSCIWSQFSYRYLDRQRHDDQCRRHE